MTLTREQLLSLPTMFTPRIFKIWRLFIVLFSIEVVIVEFSTCPRKFHERIRFLTVWGYLLNCTAQILLYVASTTNPQLHPKKNAHVSPLWKAGLLVYEIAFSLQFPITIVYWAAIFPTDKYVHGIRLHFQNLQVHLFILLAFITDFYISAVYFDKRHGKWVIAVTVCYLAFNFTCTFLDKPVYEVINWKDKMSYVFGSVAVILCISAFYLFAHISTARFKRIEARLRAHQKELAIQ